MSESAKPDLSDPFLWHEAMDRASLFANLIASDLLEHPAVQSDANIRGLVDRAAQALYDAYQAIGVKRFHDE